jgi:uncharacterized protein with NRDE domain
VCTLVVAIGHWDEAPLVVMANRDERLSRPSRPPSWRIHGSTRVFAPVDDEAGGTWIGLSEGGLVAAITNRFGAAPDPERASRGTLVLDALDQGDLSGVWRWINTDLDPASTNPFHLVISDGQTGALAWSDGSRLFREELERGFHIVSERSFSAAPSPREDRIWGDITSINGSAPPDTAQVQSLLARHDEDPARATCVHLDAAGYGTRSWSHIQLGSEAGDFSWHEASGSPCTTDAHSVL